MLAKYATYYNEIRTHISLAKDAPCTRAIERFGDVVAHPIAVLFMRASSRRCPYDPYDDRHRRPADNLRKVTVPCDC